MNIKNAQFIKGVVGEESIMYDGTPHVAFIGRSNVGKSSTLNALLERNKLVKTGRTPGKTREINFFDVSTTAIEKVYFVDLPGYGYAKVSKTDRKKLEDMIKWYITHPQSDTELIVLIIDAKAGLTNFDKQMIYIMDQADKDYILAVNKIDKINQKAMNKLKNAIKTDIPNATTGENIFYYSAFKNKNVYLLRDRILGQISDTHQ